MLEFVHDIMSWNPVYSFVKQKGAIITLLLIVMSIPYRYGDLSKPLLCHGDEALTALRSLGLMEQGHYWTPYWNGKVNLHKPPFYYQIVALGYRLWGIGEVAVRLPSVLSYMALVLLAYRMTRRIMDAWSGCLAAALLAFNPVLFSQSRVGMMDTWVVLWTMIGGYSLWRAAKQPVYYWIWGAACGAALFTKAAGAILILPISWMYLAMAHRTAFRQKTFYLALLAGLVLPIAWFASQYILHADYLIEGYVNHEIRYRIKHDMWESFLQQKTAKQLWRAWGALAPLSVIAPMLLFFFPQPNTRRSVFKHTWRQSIFFYVMLGSTLIGTSLISQQLYWYVLPCIPPMAIMMAMAVRAASSSPQRILLFAALASGFFLEKCFMTPVARWMFLVGLMICAGLCIRGPQNQSIRALVMSIAIGISVWLGVSMDNRYVNLTRYRKATSLYTIASQLPPPKEAPRPLVINFSHYPKNVLLFYSRRTAVSLKKYLKEARGAEEIRYGVFENDAYTRIRGVETKPLSQSGRYTLVQLKNSASVSIKPEYENEGPSN